MSRLLALLGRRRAAGDGVFSLSGELDAGDAPSAGYVGFNGAWVVHNWDDGSTYGSLDPASLGDNIAALVDGQNQGSPVDTWLVLRPNFATAHGAGVEYDVTVTKQPSGEPVTTRVAPFPGWGNIGAAEHETHPNGPYSLWRSTEPLGIEDGETYSFAVVEVTT